MPAAQAAALDAVVPAKKGKPAHPAVDWPAVSAAFVTSLSLEYNPFTTQIEPHDWIGEYCDAVAAANTILIDLCRDFWGYIHSGICASVRSPEKWARRPCRTR